MAGGAAVGAGAAWEEEEPAGVKGRGAEDQGGQVDQVCKNLIKRKGGV